MKVRTRIFPNALAILIAGLVVALPLVGLDCEMACAGTARGAASSHALPPGHCPAHEASGTAPDSSRIPESCGHHADFAAVKKAGEGIGQRHAASTIADLSESAVPALDSRSFSEGRLASARAPRTPSPLSRILRL